MRYALLGPVSVVGDEGPLEINGTLRRTLLAALLLHPNQAVSADQLAELLWGQRPRVAATTSLYNQVMRLRRALGPHAGRVRAAAPGYLIEVVSGELDTTEFARHRAAAAEAAGCGSWARSAHHYEQALALWRGEPLADLPALQSSPEILRLVEERILAVQGRIEAELYLGRHEQVIGELRTLADQHPWREAFHGQLMLALYRAGRQPEALEVYRALHRATTAEFGVEPGRAVRTLHTRILRSDPELGHASAEATPRPTGRPVSPSARAPVRQLPADTRAFTGRESELDTLIAAARPGHGGADGAGGEDAAPTVVISAINGMGGIGKTALAIRAAHRLAEHYPDGQLFIDLHGHSADLDPVKAPDALDYLLRSLGVEPKAIPQEPQERAAFYRSRLAGTRTLIVLDNARNPAQVRPLIPAEPGCLVLVTSRSQLAGLDDADFLSLDALPPDEAVALLGNAAGPGRIDRHDPAARELTEWCGRLPLAVRILGARLRHRRMLSPAALLEALRTDGDPLALLKDDGRDITRVFASSLEMLPDAERLLFARLGLIPGPDFDAYAAAALQGIGVAEAERQLESLFDHSLLIQHKEGRYRLHDLLRAYARTRVDQGDPARSEAAGQRLFDYYVDTAGWARTLWLGGTSRSRRAARDVSGTEGIAEGVAWFEAEQRNIFAVLEHPALDPRRKIELLLHFTPHLRGSGPWDRLTALQSEAVDLARQLRDHDEESRALRNLGDTYLERGMLPEAIGYLEQAVAVAHAAGNLLVESRALCRLGWAYSTNETSLALHYAQRAADLVHGTEYLVDEAWALHVLAGIANQNGRFEETIAAAIQVIELCRDGDYRFLEGAALFHLSHAYYALGRFDEIEPILIRNAECYGESRRGMAGVVQELGRLRMMRGQYAEATEYIERAARDFTELGFQLGAGYAYGELGRIRLHFGDLDGAAACQQTALRFAVDSGNNYVETFIRTNIGYLHIARGEFAQAQGQLRTGLEIAATGGFLLCQVEARVGICALAYARDGAVAALPYYREALGFVREIRHPREEAAALVGLGRCELETGARDSGAAHLHEAIALYQRMGSAFHVAETRKYLN